MPGDNPAFVLVHSPLVGPLTWASVADKLRQRRIDAVVPSLLSDRQSSLPYWQQHVNAVVSTLESLPSDRSVILIGHSGAGMLLPAIRHFSKRAVAGYIYADAGIPKNGVSRLEMFASPEEAQRFRATAINGLLPTWSDEDLREAIPDAALRQQFVAELRPLPLAVYEEAIPVFEGWPDAPCGYLKFTEFYTDAVQQAHHRGWAFAEIKADHFHMLNDPGTVTEMLVSLAQRMGIPLA